MRTRWNWMPVLLPLLICCGCLSIGGRTIHQENPATEGRLQALEDRMSRLERTLTPQPYPPSP